MSESLKLNSAFVGLNNKPVPTKTDYSKDKDIVEYEEQEYVEKTGEGDTDFVVKKRIIEKSRVNRQEFVNSFSDDVGIHNILKKVKLTGDDTLLKQRPDAPYFDATQFQTSRSDLVNAVNNGVKAFDELPDDVKKKMSMETFVNTFSQKDFDALVQAKVDAIMAAKKKEGEGE